jgi:hypothetical protein
MSHPPVELSHPPVELSHPPVELSHPSTELSHPFCAASLTQSTHTHTHKLCPSMILTMVVV